MSYHHHSSSHPVDLSWIPYHSHSWSYLTKSTRGTKFYPESKSKKKKEKKKGVAKISHLIGRPLSSLAIGKGSGYAILTRE